ncbi:MAG: hypothetical protein WC635_16665 [Bacteriovorax sp.]|jgi:hypothetical protein
MKSLLFLSLVISFGSKAEVGRSPAVVGGVCDLDIATTKIKPESEKIFTQDISHKVTIRSDLNSAGCSSMPKNKYPDSVFEEHARNELHLLFQKYPDNYSRKCARHFTALGLKKSDFVCETPAIVSIDFAQFGCEKKIEDGTEKITFAGFTQAAVKYQQRGYQLVEKSLETVQKEQCARVNECMEQASDKEMPELKKLAVVACKNELAPVSAGRAPAIEKDASSNDGKRIPKSAEQKEEKTSVKESSAAGK